MDFSGRLRAARQSFGLTLDEMCSRAGISKTYLWELEQACGGPVPSADVLARLADAVGMSMDQLWRGSAPNAESKARLARDAIQAIVDAGKVALIRIDDD